MRIAVRAGLVIFLAGMVCGVMLVGHVSLSGAEAPPSGPTVTNVRVDPPIPRTGDKVKLSFNLAGGAIRADVQWFYNGEDLGTVYYDGYGPPLELDRVLKAGDKLVVAITAYDASGDRGKVVEQKIECRKAPPILKLSSEDIKGEIYTAKIEATDPEGGKVKLSLEQAPKGMTIDQQGNIEWKLQRDVSSRNIIKVKGEDDKGQKSFLTYEVSIRWQQQR